MKKEIENRFFELISNMAYHAWRLEEIENRYLTNNEWDNEKKQNSLFLENDYCTKDDLIDAYNKECELSEYVNRELCIMYNGENHSIELMNEIEENIHNTLHPEGYAKDLLQKINESTQIVEYRNKNIDNYSGRVFGAMNRFISLFLNDLRRVFGNYVDNSIFIAFNKNGESKEYATFSECLTCREELKPKLIERLKSVFRGKGKVFATLVCSLEQLGLIVCEKNKVKLHRLISSEFGCVGDKRGFTKYLEKNSTTPMKGYYTDKLKQEDINLSTNVVSGILKEIETEYSTI
jgi:hypothetical protein